MEIIQIIICTIKIREFKKIIPCAGCCKWGFIENVRTEGN